MVGGWCAAGRTWDCCSRRPDFVHRACTDYPGQIVIAIDARDGNVSIEGWTKVSGCGPQT